jgi:acetaldehyde dehydrogenase (acetylating)
LTPDKPVSNRLARCLLATLVASLVASVARPGDARGDDRASTLAQRVQQLTGISSGLCGIVDYDDPALPLALARDGRFFVHVLDPRRDSVNAIRTAVDRESLYGKRIAAGQPR